MNSKKPAQNLPSFFKQTTQTWQIRFALPRKNWSWRVCELVNLVQNYCQRSCRETWLLSCWENTPTLDCLEDCVQWPSLLFDILLLGHHLQYNCLLRYWFYFVWQIAEETNSTITRHIKRAALYKRKNTKWLSLRSQE